jgi:hypothetical protein
LESAVTTPLLDLSAAADALHRLDNNTPRPGDADLAAAFERLCRQQQEVFEDHIREAEHALWLAEQCPVCEEGGTGPECDECFIAHDALMRRVEDQ